MADQDWVLVQSETNKSLLEPSSSALADQTKTLLANNVTVYFRAHGYHWNVKGIHFAAYHKLFQKIYEDLYEAIDPTGEWLRKLGYDAIYTLDDFMTYRTIQEPIKQVTLPMMIQTLLEGIQQLEECTEHCLEMATQENEQGLINFLGERIDMLEKWEWQLNTSINEGFM